jgi:hypothetical protein
MPNCKPISFDNGYPSDSMRECVHHIAVLRIQGIQEIFPDPVCF